MSNPEDSAETAGLSQTPGAAESPPPPPAQTEPLAWPPATTAPPQRDHGAWLRALTPLTAGVLALLLVLAGFGIGVVVGWHHDNGDQGGPAGFGPVQRHVRPGQGVAPGQRGFPPGYGFARPKRPGPPSQQGQQGQQGQPNLPSTPPPSVRPSPSGSATS